MALVNCPTCRKPFDPAQSRAMPFCSDRCRQIDLRRWLNEEISIPVRDQAEEDRGPSADEPSND